MKDYYSILGVPKDAAQEEIKRAYNLRVRAVHPDRFEMGSPEWENANKALIDVNEAYSHLRTPESRARYDTDFRRGNARPNTPPKPASPPPHEILGVSPDASKEEAMAAFQRKKMYMNPVNFEDGSDERRQAEKSLQELTKALDDFVASASQRNAPPSQNKNQARKAQTAKAKKLANMLRAQDEVLIDILKSKYGENYAGALLCLFALRTFFIDFALLCVCGEEEWQLLRIEMLEQVAGEIRYAELPDAVMSLLPFLAPHAVKMANGMANRADWGVVGAFCELLSVTDVDPYATPATLGAVAGRALRIEYIEITERATKICQEPSPAQSFSAPAPGQDGSAAEGHGRRAELATARPTCFCRDCGRLFSLVAVQRTAFQALLHTASLAVGFRAALARRPDRGRRCRAERPKLYIRTARLR